MRHHKNAALTQRQRAEIRRLYASKKHTLQSLAERYGVHRDTIRKWAYRPSSEDHSSAPKQPYRVVTEEYRQAVCAYRAEHPGHGAIRIAEALRSRFPEANRGTVGHILREQRLTRPPSKKAPPSHLPVGRHRLQMDVQQLPAIKGASGFEYKISIIHLATRVKYSEIHPKATSRIVAAVFERAIKVLPPFLSSGPTTP
jgi:transposase-like protein